MFAHGIEPACLRSVGRILYHAEHRCSDRREADKLEYASAQAANAVAAKECPVQPGGHSHGDSNMRGPASQQLFGAGLLIGKSHPGPYHLLKGEP